MALSKTITLSGNSFLVVDLLNINLGQSEKTLEDCYIKVASVESDKAMGLAQVAFCAGETSFARSYPFTVDLEGPNFIKQAYEHLKTLPEFEGAEDC
jgi:hypothetical protein